MTVAISVFAATGPQAVADTTYAEEARLEPSDIADSDHFAQAVGVWGDTVVAGFRVDDLAGGWLESAYVFVRNGDAWSEQARLTASDGAAGDYFGSGDRSVGVWGDTIVVGSSGHDDPAEDSGSAYVFVRSGDTWTEQAKLTASDATAQQHFGSSVAVSGDTIVVGAPDAYQSDGTGSAYVFVRSGDTWTEQAKLVASDAAPGDEFGFSVAASEDTIIVGAREDDDSAGAAYVFARSGESWSEQAKLVASDAAPNTYFGGYVAISGETAVATAPERFEPGIGSGAAYVFVRDGVAWSEQAILTASPTSLFGYSVAMSGETVVVGAVGDSTGGDMAGAAFVFTRTGTTWIEQAKLIASDAAAGATFGDSVAVSGDTVVASGWSSTAYVFVSGQGPADDTLYVSSDMKLGSDQLGPIEIVADWVTLDCAGYSVKPGEDPQAEAETGITVNGRVGVTVKNCRIEGGFETALAVTDSTRSWFLRNELATTRTNGAVMESSRAIRFIHNTIETLSNTVQLMNVDRSYIANNVIWGASGGGFVLSEGSDFNVVKENTIGSVFGSAIALFDSVGNTVKGNSAADGAVGGIWLRRTSDTKVFDNIVRNYPGGPDPTDGWGILVDDSTGALLYRNHTTGVKHFGIRLAETADSVLALNDASRNGSGIEIDRSMDILAKRNVANGNDDNGVSVLDSSKVRIKAGRAFGNSAVGILLDRSHDSRVVGTATKDNSTGVLIVDSDRNKVLFSSASGNGSNGFVLSGTAGQNTLKFNVACRNANVDALDQSTGVGNTWAYNKFCTADL